MFCNLIEGQNILHQFKTDLLSCSVNVNQHTFSVFLSRATQPWLSGPVCLHLRACAIQTVFEKRESVHYRVRISLRVPNVGNC